GDLVPEEAIAPSRRHVEAAGDLEEGRFPAPRRARDADELAGLDGEVDSPQGMDHVQAERVDLLDPPELDHRHTKKNDAKAQREQRSAKRLLRVPLLPLRLCVKFSAGL